MLSLNLHIYSDFTHILLRMEVFLINFDWNVNGFSSEEQMLLASGELKDATAAQQALQQQYGREVDLSRRRSNTNSTWTKRKNM